MTQRSFVSLSLLGMTIVTTAGVILLRQNETWAHCQVPCGIYDDAARIRHLKEDATTIAKAIAGMNDLTGQSGAQAFNQAARWVTTKEDHASDIIEIVAQYFLTQRVKPVEPGADGYEAYLKKLADHHAVMVAAMKTKQSADPTTVADLNKAIDKLSTHY